MLGVLLIIAYAMIIEFIAVRMNRAIVRNTDRNADTLVFNVRYANFSFFLSVILCISLAAFTHFFITNFGLIDAGSITSLILLLFNLFDLIRKLFFKIEVNGKSINFKSITKRISFSFDDIKKVEVIKVFGTVQAELYSDEDSLFTLKNGVLGYYLFIERLKKEHVDWRTILGKPLDKSDI